MTHTSNNGNGGYDPNYVDDGGPGLPTPSARRQEVLAEAWTKVLAYALDHTQGEWDREFERLSAECGEVIAKMRAEIAELRSNFEIQLVRKLAALRDGVDGAPGPSGPPGEAGPKGEQGAPGQLPLCRSWTASEIHYAGAVVHHKGSTWQAARDTAQEPGHPDWVCLAVAGATPRIRGTWNASTDYQAFDLVARDGGSFIALKDDPGVCPGQYWQSVAQSGKRGHTGEKGERGERGLPGSSILRWAVDRENYTATPVMSDGTLGAPLSLRDLFEQFQDETE
jgi:hypothetical protein